MRTLEMKIEIPEVKGIRGRSRKVEIGIPKVKGGRCVSTKMQDGYILATYEIEEDEEKMQDGYILATYEIEEDEEKNEIHHPSKSEFECRIDPNAFEGEWMKHEPITEKQKEILNLYQTAKAENRLHAFTCMTIDPSFKYGRLVYQKGLEPALDFSMINWARMFEGYNPSRNSRLMTRTEHVCRNLFLIGKLVESGYEIKDAWAAVCDNSEKIGHYYISCSDYALGDVDDFEPTGSREICGFCDLANTDKILAVDPWEKNNSFYLAGSFFEDNEPVAHMIGIKCDYDFPSDYDYRSNYGVDTGVGMLALD